MQVPSHSAPNALDRFSSNSHRTANADLRQRTQTRRVEIQGLTHEGTVKDFTGLAPARPLFEEAFSAFCHGTLLATPNGPMAVAASKQVIVEQSDWSQSEMWPKQQEIVNPVFTSEDAIEGATAFAEKRAPNWKGK